MTIPTRSSRRASRRPRADTSTFGWAVAPRVGRDLALRLGRGEKVMIRSVVKAEMLSGRARSRARRDRRRRQHDQEVAIGGHLYEGYIKQGANDDNSGCALTLEIGRAYIKLIKEGKLPRPKRTINFQWVPEISGTNAWLERASRQGEGIIGDLNFDMEGHPAGDEPQLLDPAADARHVSVLHQRHRAEHDGVRVGAHARARALPRPTATRRRHQHHGAQRQQRRVLHQDRQALRRRAIT